MSRILLVEDDDLIGTMVRLVLQQEGYEVHWHTSGEDGVAATQAQRFDAILLDITLPGMSGLEVASALRSEGVGAPILMLTSLDNTARKVEALGIGADDYICKPFDMAELLARLKAQIRRSQAGLELPTDTILSFGAGRFDADGRRLWSAQGDEVTLSDKELDMVSLFIRCPGRALTRADILDEVWGMEVTPTERTVDNFIVRLRRWVELEPDRPRHIVTVHGTGYRYDP